MERTTVFSLGHTHDQRPTRHGFTLIELLVVISIIALLVGILLPALGAARRTAQNSQCLSNIRQMDTAAMSFAADHQFHVQISSTDTFWTASGRIPSQLSGRVAAWVQGTGASAQAGRIKDWASAIVPYMGGGATDTFDSTDKKVSKAFICPSDANQADDPPGYEIFNNITGGTTINKHRLPISYGVNADATTYMNNGSASSWGPFTMKPYKGDVTNGSLDAVRSTSSTMLYADCGTRNGAGNGTSSSNPLVGGDHLFYTATTIAFGTTPENEAGTLAIVEGNSNARRRIPLSDNNSAEGPGDRHNDRINVAFTDGHAASFAPGNFEEVYLSPHK